ncbi:MAG: tetratricopeptide repeat protein [Gemmatimonadota bacterium]
MRLRAVLAPAILAVSMAALAHGAAAAGGGIPDADPAAIRRLFEGRRFAELAALLERDQASCDRDIRYEYAAHNGFAALAVPAPSWKPLFDDWVRSAPGSWVPLTARAAYRKASGWKERGAGAANATADERFRGMVDDFLLAVRDLEASLRIRPRQLYAYVVLMEISQNLGDRGRDARLAQKALGLYPDSYLLRRRRMISLTPRWGGSYEAMERFAREAAPHVARNPRLKILPGFIPWDRGRRAARAGDYRAAIALYREALSHGESWNFLYDLADGYYRAEMYAEALSALDRAIAANPGAAEGHGLRSKIRFAQGDLDGALASLETAERLAGPGGGDASAIRRWESRRLVSDGHACFKGGNLAAAIGHYTAAVRFDPRNADAFCWRGIAFDRSGDPAAAVADLRRAVDLDPRLFPAYEGLDDALYRLGRVDEIVASWSRLIALEPGNDNAYVRRSGAYSRTRDRGAAIRDLDRACGMGNEQACFLLKSLPGAVGR